TRTGRRRAELDVRGSDRDPDRPHRARAHVVDLPEWSTVENRRVNDTRIDAIWKRALGFVGDGEHMSHAVVGERLDAALEAVEELFDQDAIDAVRRARELVRAG